MAKVMTSPSREPSATGDRTGRDFWDQWWQRTPLPEPIDPYRGGLKNYPFRSLHRFFQEAFRDEDTRQRLLIEIGCAQSVFLPYFARYFGFRVAGLDRSEIGCERARQILERENSAGDIHRGDLFAPPSGLVGAFDVAVSFGVIEHFNDTAAAVRAVSRFLKPDAVMITLVPNLTGMLGRYQRLLDHALYGAHVPLDQKSLARAHRESGLEVQFSGYLMPLGLEVLNVESWRSRLARKLVMRAHGMLTRLVWLVDDHLFRLPPNHWTSPYVACVARRTGA